MSSEKMRLIPDLLVEKCYKYHLRHQSVEKSQSGLIDRSIEQISVGLILNEIRYSRFVSGTAASAFSVEDAEYLDATNPRNSS